MSLLLKSQSELDEYIQKASQEQIRTDIEYHLQMATISSMELKESVQLTPSQHKHLQLISQLVYGSKMSLGELEVIVGENVPFVVLAMDPQVHSLYHPFLLYSRYKIRTMIKTCMPLLKAEKMVQFVESAVESITNDKSELVNSILGQMVFEIANFYFVVEEYERSLAMFQRVLEFIHGGVQPNRYFETDSVRVNKFISTLKSLLDIPQVSDSVTTRNLVVQVLKYKRYNDPSVLDLLIQDCIEQSIPILQKEMIRTEVAISNEIRLKSLVSFCIAISRSFSETDESQISRDLEWIYWDVGLLKECLAIISRLYQSEQFPIHLDQLRWLEYWTGLLYTQTSHLQGAVEILKHHPIMNRLLDAYPILSKSHLKHGGVNRLVELKQRPFEEANALLMEVLVTGITDSEATSLTILDQLAFEVSSDVVPLLIQSIRELLKKEKYNAAEQLLQFLKFKVLKLQRIQPASPEIQSLEATILIARVVDHLNLIDPQKHANDIQNFSVQLLESVNAAVPFNLKGFTKLLTTLLKKGQGQTAFQYIQQIKTLQKPDFSMSNAMFNLGRILILVSTTIQFLKSFGITLEKRDSNNDIDKLHGLSNEFIAELVSFSTQIVVWIAGEDIPDMIYDVHDQLIDFFQTLPCGIWDLIFGIVGGSLSRLSPDQKKIDIASLGIYSVFTTTSSNWEIVGSKGLETRVILGDLSVTEHGIENILLFLTKCCEVICSSKSLRNARTYQLWGDLYYFQNKPRQSVDMYLNSMLVYSNHFMDIAKLNQFLSGSSLQKLLKSLTELNGIFVLRESLDVLFLSQFSPTINYEHLYGLLTLLSYHDLEGERGLFVDPPNITTNVSPLFCIFDVYLLEKIVSILSSLDQLDEKQLNITRDIMLRRLKGPHIKPGAPSFAMYCDRIKIWYLSCMINRYQSTLANQ